MFARRFSALCRSFVKFFRSVSDEKLIVTPINEASFLSWLGGEARGTSPYCIQLGWEVKYALMKAYIEGVAAMKEIDPAILILATEPLINIVPPTGATEEEIAAAAIDHEHQYQAMDILTGAMCPELGGRPGYMDIAGFNYYYNNQWELGYRAYLPWVNIPEDPRWLPLSTILLNAYSRYRCPFIIAETSHPGEHRANWIESVSGECAAVLETGVPFWGVCIYPIIDRPDWDNIAAWHHAGLWDEDSPDGSTFKRVLNTEYAQALMRAQEITRNAVPAELELA